ncbi:MAG: hypothetical protein AAFQ87_05395 [Bacteroidota bacterium]
MRIALLCTEPIITQWFRQAYPDIRICEEADESFMSAEYLLLASWYEIDERFFQILPFWERYCRLRLSAKKLVLLGWKPFKKGQNYLQISSMPTDWDHWGKSVLRMRQKPVYPCQVEEDITIAIERILHSHGERAFQKMLGKAQTLLRPIERAIQEKKRSDDIRNMQELSHTDELMAELFHLWKERKPYFSLLPQYEKLKQFEQIYFQWQKMITDLQAPEVKLSKQISTYVKEVIIGEIIRVYKMEKMS